MQTYIVNGKEFQKPCTNLRCPKHSFIKRSEYADRLILAIEQSPYAYFIVLPIGKFISEKQLSRLWQAYTQSFRYKYGKQAIEYFFMKEGQNNNFHLHGIFLSGNGIDCSWMRRQWLKFLHKHTQEKSNLEDTRCEYVDTIDGSAKYVTKDMTNPKGLQTLPRQWYTRLVMRSQNIFNDDAKIFN
jgi:hypothetical protein